MGVAGPRCRSRFLVAVVRPRFKIRSLVHAIAIRFSKWHQLDSGAYEQKTKRWGQRTTGRASENSRFVPRADWQFLHVPSSAWHFLPKEQTRVFPFALRQFLVLDSYIYLPSSSPVAWPRRHWDVRQYLASTQTRNGAIAWTTRINVQVIFTPLCGRRHRWAAKNPHVLAGTQILIQTQIFVAILLGSVKTPVWFSLTFLHLCSALFQAAHFDEAVQKLWSWVSIFCTKMFLSSQKIFWNCFSPVSMRSRRQQPLFFLPHRRQATTEFSSAAQKTAEFWFGGTNDVWTVEGKVNLWI